MSVPGSAPFSSIVGRNGQSMDQGAMSEQQMVKYMTAAFESCPTKTVMAGTMGFALGGMFGLFMSSMRYDTPASLSMPGSAAAAVQSLPMREQLRAGLKDMGKASFSSAKNFGTVGAVFSGVECCIEGLRAKNDLENGVAAGCITGGILARNAGPQAMAIGCVGFAAFSAAIDSYMRQPSETAGGKIE